MSDSPTKRKGATETWDKSDAAEPSEKKPKFVSKTCAEWIGKTVTLANILIEEKRETEIVVLKYDTKVKDALQILQKENILGAPVTATGHALHSDNDDFFFGICDVFSIMRALFQNELIAGAEAGKRWENLAKAAEQLEESKVMDVISGAESRYFSKPIAEASLKDLIFNGFFKGDFNKPHPAHRVVLWENNKIQTVITQSDVMKFIWHHKDHLSATFKKTVHQLHLEKGSDTVADSALAIDAFYQMYQNDHSCVAVVDKSGKIVESLSQSDLRGLTTEDVAHLAKETVLEFVKRKHSGSQEDKKIKRKRPVLHTVKAGAHLDAVVKDLVEKRVHRVWVVDGKNHPVGVVTLTDVLKVLIQ